MTVAITATATQVSVASPYDPQFPARARELGGRWNPDGKTWVFDPRSLEQVRALCRDIFGTDGSDADEPGLTIRIPVTAANNRKDDAEFRPGGRRLVWRPSRDADVQYGADVVLVSGGFPGSAGSASYPELAPRPGTVIEARDLPRGTAEKILAEVPGATLVDGDAQLRIALTDERARLLARLAEIDAQLATLGPEAAA